MSTGITLRKGDSLPTSSPVSEIWRSNIYIGYAILSAVAVAYSNSAQRTFLSDERVDGFTSQVVYIWNYLAGGNSLLGMDPLLWIHAVRALIAYIFVEIELVAGSGAVTAAIIALTLPIVGAFSSLRRGYLVFSLPLITMFLSSRTVLVIIAVAYLVLYMRKGNGGFYLTLSFILANLSSGTVMNNLIISTTVVRNHRRSLGLHIYIALLVGSFLISASDKYVGFSEQRAGYDATVYGASGLWAILSRSTIFVSAMNADYLRLAGYVGLGLVAFGLLFFTLRSRQYRGYLIILLSAVPSLVFEGLGFMSLLVPILLLLAGARLPCRPQAPVRAHG